MKYSRWRRTTPSSAGVDIPLDGASLVKWRWRVSPVLGRWWWWWCGSMATIRATCCANAGRSCCICSAIQPWIIYQLAGHKLEVGGVGQIPLSWGHSKCNLRTQLQLGTKLIFHFPQKQAQSMEHCACTAVSIF